MKEVLLILTLLTWGFFQYVLMISMIGMLNASCTDNYGNGYYFNIYEKTCLNK